MCPSYQATHEEKYTTRGRARLLFEMLQGEVITDGWESREVFDALDLCLACKGCTSDCPVNVDMPTYKSEFLYHHYQSPRRWRPRYAYAFGFIDQAARLASLMPGVTNFVLHAPGLSRVAKLAAGIDQRRPLPSVRADHPAAVVPRPGRQQEPGLAGRWCCSPTPSTTTCTPQVGVACVEAIEAAGWRVIMPEGHVCCGRPLYDYGFLDAAERYLKNVLDTLRDYVRAGIPVVGMEPSCLAVFKDELVKLLPHDDDAKRLADSACHFGEFFTRYDISPPATAAARRCCGDTAITGPPAASIPSSRC